MHIIVFQKDENDFISELQDALNGYASDEDLNVYDIFQDDWSGDYQIVLGKIDARDEKNFGDAVKQIGVYDRDFHMTFPLYLIIKDGKGYLGSLTRVTKNGKLTPAFRKKLVDGIGAKVAKQKSDDDNNGSTGDDDPDNPDGNPDDNKDDNSQ